MIKKIKDITLFIDDESITDAKILVPYSSSNKKVIYYTVEGFFDDSGEKRKFSFLSHGSTTLKILQVQAIKETKERSKFK
jgi:hypothetical protein